MKGLYKNGKHLWIYNFIIVIASLLSSIIIFLVSFNMLNGVLPANSYTNGSSVIFKETGLPANTTWNVTFNGSTKNSNSSAIIFISPNGSYNFTVGILNNYVPDPSCGNLIVNGSNVVVNITFKRI